MQLPHFFLLLFILLLTSFQKILCVLVKSLLNVFFCVSTFSNRQAWGHHIDLHDSHLLALEHQLLQSEYEDYAVTNTSSLACLRSVALIVSKPSLNNILMYIDALLCAFKLIAVNIMCSCL
jgi:hypothetical protein